MQSLLFHKPPSKYKKNNLKGLLQHLLFIVFNNIKKSHPSNMKNMGLLESKPDN